jgi:outer membrane receptor protein involved in Fe transport
VGNVVTNANAGLHAERSTGGAAGVNFQKFAERLTFRSEFFWNQINNSIANVTLSSTPALITRQRQNLGVIRARGFEMASAFRASEHLTLSAQYLLTDSTVLRFPVNQTLEGLWVPQVQRHQFNFQISYDRRKWTAGVQGRVVGTAFDDDLNLLPLNPFVTLDAEVAHALSRNFEVFFAAQNLTGARYQVARSPVVNLGPPTLARIGLRVQLAR